MVSARSSMFGAEASIWRSASPANSDKPTPISDGDTHQRRDLARDQPGDLTAPRAERHPDTDFSRPLRHGKGHDGVETDASQGEPQRAERAQKRARRLGKEQGILHVPFQRLCRDDRQCRVQSAQFTLHRTDECRRVERGSSEHGGRRTVGLQIRPVKERACTVRDIGRRLLGHADDLEPGCRVRLRGGSGGRSPRSIRNTASPCLRRSLRHEESDDGRVRRVRARGEWVCPWRRNSLAPPRSTAEPRSDPRSPSPSLDDHRPAAYEAGWRIQLQDRALHSRNRRNALPQLFVHSLNLRRGVAAVSHIRLEHGDASHLEADVLLPGRQQEFEEHPGP